MQPASLQIILPCYNPQSGWEKNLVKRVQAFQELLPKIKMGVVLVNDGSLKGVGPAQIEFLYNSLGDFQFIDSEKNEGKGHALRKGVDSATAPYLIYTDIDLPYTAESMRNVFTRLMEGADVVVGVRNNEYYEKVPFRRMLISKMLKGFIKVLLRTPITDTQCGLKGFNQRGREIFLETHIDRFLFDMEFIKIAFHRRNLKVIAQTVVARPDIVFSEMNYMVLAKEAFNFIRLGFLHNRMK